MVDALNADLNSVITAAVNAKIEAQLMNALASDEILSAYVVAALSQEIVVKDHSGYNSRKTTFIKNALDKALQAATEEALRKLLLEQTPIIEAAVREKLSSMTDAIAEQLIGSVVRAATSNYGITVELKFPG